MAVRVLTLNVWGLWLASRDRELRVRHLADYFRTATDLDLVLLQEVWVDQDADLLISAAQQAGLSHSVHFKSGIFGSGLITLSRYPITETGFHRYSAAGDALAVHCGDFLAGKGVGWVRVAAPEGSLDVYNTHLHANYSHKVLSERLEATPPHTHTRDTRSSNKGAARAWHVSVPQDRYAPFRVCQINELAQVVRTVSGCDLSRAFILGGDLNTKPYFLEMALLRCLLPELQDSWVCVHGDTREGPGAGLTCRAPECTYKSTRQIPERIDYVLYAGLSATSARLALHRTPSGCSYSDHLAVMVELSMPPSQASAKSATQPTASASHSIPTVSTNRFPWQSPFNQATAPESTTPGTGPAQTQSANAKQPAAAQSAATEDVLCALGEVLPCAMMTVRRGVTQNTQRGRQRLKHGLTCWAAALALATSALWTPLTTHTTHAATSSTQGVIRAVVAPLVSVVLAAAGALLLVIGAVADPSQARAMRQTLTCMQCTMAAVKGSLEAQRDKK